MKALALLLAALLPVAGALAQDHKKQSMSRDGRERMRQDMRDVKQGARPDRPRQMTPQEREKLRQDIQEANKNLRR